MSQTVPYTRRISTASIVREDYDDIAIDDQGALMRSYSETTGGINMLLEGFSHFLNSDLNDLIVSNLTITTSTTRIEPTGHRLIKPHIVNPNKDDPTSNSIDFHGPSISALLSDTYASNILIDLLVTQNLPTGKTVQFEVKNVSLGSIPIMVGCDYCNIKDRTKAEEYGESSTVPPGYFVAVGQKRIAPTIERLRTNMWLYYNAGKLGNIAVFTAMSESATEQIKLTQDVALKSIDVFVTGFVSPDKPIPVFFLIHYLWLARIVAGYDSEDDISEILENPEVYITKQDIWAMISRYTKYPEAVRRVLVPTFAAFDSTPRDTAHLFSSIVKTDTAPARRGPKKKVAKKEEAEDVVIDERDVLASVTQLVFPYMNSDDPEVIIRKIENLCIGIAGYAERLAGVSPIYNRDSYAVKRCEPIASKYKSLMNKCLKMHRAQLQAEYEGQRTVQLSEATIRSSFAKNQITQIFTKAVQTGVWGPKSQYTVENVTELSKADSYIAYYSQVLRESRPVQERTKGDGIRSNQWTQVGYVSLAHTPESQKVGLVLNIANGMFISYNDGEELIMNHLNSLNDLWQPDYSADMTTPLILNGKLIGHCKAIQMIQNLNNIRRISMNDTRMSVSLTRYNQVVISTDADRPTRPLLIVDTFSQKTHMELYHENSGDDLVKVLGDLYGPGDYEDLARRIDELKEQYGNLWRAPFKSLYNLGVFEFVDPFELEFGVTPVLNPNINQDLVDELMQILNDPNTSDEDKLSIESQIFNEQYALTENVISPTPNHLVIQRQNLQAIIDNRDEDVAKQIIEYKEHHTYVYCEIDPTMIMSAAESCTPFAEHDQAPRITYQCKMAAQALSSPTSNNILRFETTNKYCTTACRPLVETQHYRSLGMTKVGSGKQVMLAFSTKFGHTIEDAFAVRHSAIENGFGHTVKESTYWSQEKDEEGSENKIKIMLKAPPIPTGADPNRYAKINQNGLPILGARVKPGDCLIGMVREVAIHNDKIKERRDVSVYVEPGAEGIVDSVMITYSGPNRIIAVKVKQDRKITYGDKVARRHAQKTTCGLIVADRDMPITDGGIIPDVIINPLCIPSRMTMGMILEMICSKIAVSTGFRFNATAFRDKNISDYIAELESLGHDGYGREKLKSQITGEYLDCDVFMAPCFEQILVHQVDDKKQFRSIGARSLTTGQPVTGRSKGGGLKSGEMERDALRDAVANVDEIYRVNSDNLIKVMCTKCSSTAIFNEKYGIEVCPVCESNENLCKVATTVAADNLRLALSTTGISVKYSYEKV